MNGPATVAVSGERDAIEELAATAADQQLWFRRSGRTTPPIRSSSTNSGNRCSLPWTESGNGRYRGWSRAAGSTPPLTAAGSAPHELVDAPYWFRNLRRPVELDAAVRAVSADARAVIEVSAHPGLVPSLLDILQDVGGTTPVLAALRRGEGGLERLTRAFAEAFDAGLPVSWATALPVEPADWRELCRELPTYPFAHRRYWLRVHGQSTRAHSVWRIPSIRCSPRWLNCPIRTG